MQRLLTSRSVTLTAAVLLALSLAGCGDDTPTSSAGTGGATTTTSVAASSSTTADAGSTPASSDGTTVALASSDLGKILVDGQGMTLYLFTPDAGTASTCNGGCAEAWPPVTGPAAAGDGVAADDLGTTTRDDGSTQVTFHGHPVYHFANDSAAGDVNGQGSGGKWFVIGADGAAIQTAAGTPPTPTSTKSSY